jgi:hypothetical protein
MPALLEKCPYRNAQFRSAARHYHPSDYLP